MPRKPDSMGREYFESLYAIEPDPWCFASSPYEAEKYASTLAALPNRRFTNALEVGCSIGIFTRQIALRCERLLALDGSESALTRARENCRLPHVTFANRQVPDEWPHMEGSFDLIVFSEVLYYLTADDVTRVAQHSQRALQPGGVVLLVHYLGETDYPLHGDIAAELFIKRFGQAVSRQSREALYRIDVIDSSTEKL